MSDVVGKPPMLSKMALIVDMPGDKCSSEYKASVARFQMNRLSGHLCFDKGRECCQCTMVCAYKQASKAGEIRSLCCWYCPRKETSSNTGKQMLTFRKNLDSFISKSIGQAIWKSEEIQYTMAVTHTSMTSEAYGSRSLSMISSFSADGLRFPERPTGLFCTLVKMTGRERLAGTGTTRVPRPAPGMADK
jgi:hypothetical protein